MFGVQNKFKVFLFMGGAGSGSPNASVSLTRTPRRECCSWSGLWEKLQLVERVAVGETYLLLFVSSKSCCCPSLGLAGPAGLDPVSACFLWGVAETGAVFSLMYQTTGGTSYFFLRAVG